MPCNVRSVAGSGDVGSVDAAEKFGLRVRRFIGEAAYGLDRLERVSKAMGHRVHAGVWKTVGLRRAMVCRSGFAHRSVGQSGEGALAQELHLLQSTAASRVHAG